MSLYLYPLYIFFFFFNDTATTEIYTLSLHDALPISIVSALKVKLTDEPGLTLVEPHTSKVDAYALYLKARYFWRRKSDRKSTRLNSSHLVISYAVFCLKKKKRSHDASHMTGPNRVQR